jgi:hypothetical protein
MGFSSFSTPVRPLQNRYSTVRYAWKANMKPFQVRAACATPAPTSQLRSQTRGWHAQYAASRYAISPVRGNYHADKGFQLDANPQIRWASPVPSPRLVKNQHDGWLFPSRILGHCAEKRTGAGYGCQGQGTGASGVRMNAGSLPPFPRLVGRIHRLHLNTNGIQAGNTFFESKNAAQRRRMTKSRGAGFVGFLLAPMDCFSLEAP